jgi:flagellar basal-body rod protein FlgB
MSINFDSALGIHDDALKVRARRSEVLASNLANADTPNYKAQDLDFKQALEQATAGSPTAGSPSFLKATHSGHIQGQPPLGTPDTQYRVPLQPSLDGNTVDSQVEKAKYAENALQYQTTLSFLSSKFSSLMGAIKGE